MFFSIHGITTYHNENDEWEYSKTYLKHKRKDGRENYNYLKAEGTQAIHTNSLTDDLRQPCILYKLNFSIKIISKMQ